MTSIDQKVFQGILGAVRILIIVKELIEIWPNEVCDTNFDLLLFICWFSLDKLIGMMVSTNI